MLTWLAVPWNVASVVIALAAGLGAALVFHRLMSRFLAPDQALFAVVLFCVAPVSPIMQFGYAESVGFLLLALALLLLVERRYALAVPRRSSRGRSPARVPSRSRSTLVLHWAWRWFRDAATRSRCASACSRHPSPCSRGSPASRGSAIAWAATGDMQAYTDTELAWRSAYIGYRELVPFTAWFQSGDWWLGQPLGTIAVIALVAAFAVLVASPAVGRLGVDIRLWSIELRAVPARGVLPAVEHLPHPRAALPAARRIRPAEGALVPMGRRRALPAAPGRLAPDLLGDRRPRLDSALMSGGIERRGGSRRARFRRWKRCPQTRRDFPVPLGMADNGDASHERGSSMAAMKPRTGDGPMEAVKEGRLIIVRVPLEGGGRLVVSVNDAEARELYDVLGGVVNPA